VLVIIGLLLGGVLQGQQLIENSRVKSATNDFNGIAAAMFSYQDRYGRLPGDDPNAGKDRGDSWSGDADTSAEGESSSKGNGRLDALSGEAFDGKGEAGEFFQNLRSAGFISGSPTEKDARALPQNPFGGLTTVVSDEVLKGSGTSGLNGTKICMTNVPGTSAIALDTQLDDGKIDAGRFRAASESAETVNIDSAGTDSYNEDTNYIVCYRI